MTCCWIHLPWLGFYSLIWSKWLLRFPRMANDHKCMVIIHQPARLCYLPVSFLLNISNLGISLCLFHFAHLAIMLNLPSRPFLASSTWMFSVCLFYQLLLPQVFLPPPHAMSYLSLHQILLLTTCTSYFSMLKIIFSSKASKLSNNK